MNVNFLQLITLFSGFLLFVLGIHFLFNHIKKQLSNQLLGAFLISNAVLLSNFFLYLTVIDYPASFPIIHNIGTHSYLLLAPLLYLYIISLCRFSFNLTIKEFLHLIPFIAMVLAGLLINHFSSKNEGSLTNYLFYSLFKLTLYIQLSAYIMVSFIELRNFRRQLNEMYSSLVKIDLQWVNLILYFLILMGSTDLALYLTGWLHFNGSGPATYLTYQTITINLILCLWLIYRGMRQTTMPAGKLPIPKYVQNNADLTNYETFKIKLLQMMENEKPFLLPELNLEELAKRLDFTARQLSQIIHVCFEQNFNNFINHYRVEEAKRLIKEDRENKKSVFEIQCDAGFNSKSVFNLSFKKLTGLTPKEFRQKENSLS